MISRNDKIKQLTITKPCNINSHYPREIYFLQYKINGAPKIFKNLPRPIFRPKTSYTCHQKPNPSRETVTLIFYLTFWVLFFGLDIQCFLLLEINIANYALSQSKHRPQIMPSLTWNKTKASRQGKSKTSALLYGSVGPMQCGRALVLPYLSSLQDLEPKVKDGVKSQ